MCGLAGFVSFEPQSTSLIKKMTELIDHRGPDDEGFACVEKNQNVHLFGGPSTPADVYQSSLAFTPKKSIQDSQEIRASLFLGHRRLSILDLAPTGHQPMTCPEQKIWIVFNGEIYNYLEIRSELIAAGVHFQSHSDTEVIIAAYKAWGISAFSKMRGMFSILIYDKLQHKLIAIRDRFGIKPLYYFISGEGIAFASEIKQFTALPGWKPVLNKQRAYDFLNWAITDHTDETFFKGVFQIRGGQFVELDLQNLTQKAQGERLPVSSWYKLTPTSFKGSFEEATYKFRQHLQNSVDIHLRSDVPVGSCLSGGLDSSSIVCLVSDSLKKVKDAKKQQTFSACVEVKQIDERPYMASVAEKANSQAHYIFPQASDLFSHLRDITWNQDEPFGSTSIFAQWSVFKLAADNKIKVMLDGQGADEQLAGYHNFFGPYLAGLLSSGRIIRFIKEANFIRKNHHYSFFKLLQRTGNSLLPEFIRQHLRGFAGKVNTRPSWINYQKMKIDPVDPFTKIGFKTCSLQDFSVSQLTASNLQMLLHWEDRNSMAHSLESRVPFLDHPLVEFVVSLPDDYKLSQGVTKKVLRRAMADTLPDMVTNRIEKLAFVTPEESWLKDPNDHFFRKSLEEAIVLSKGILNDQLLETFDKMKKGEIGFNTLPWRCISFGVWMKVFEVEVE